MNENTNELVKDILVRSRALLAQGFCQRTFAKDKNGRDCPSSGEEAVAWCSTGAISRISVELQASSRAVTDVYILLTRVTDSPIVYFNDFHTQEEVLAKFDEAIGLLNE